MNFLYPDGFGENASVFPEEYSIDNAYFDGIRRYFTADGKILEYRQAIFKDILAKPDLTAWLEQLDRKLDECANILKDKITDNIEHLSRRLLYPKVFIELTTLVYEGLRSYKDTLKSEAFQGLWTKAETDYNSDTFKTIEEYYKQNGKGIQDIKSITVGVNLNAVLEPKEAGIVSFNSEIYRSGDFLDRLLSLDFDKDNFHCLASLTNLKRDLSYQENLNLNHAVLHAMSSTLKSGARQCSVKTQDILKNLLLEYVQAKESIKFILNSSKIIAKMKEKGYPLCFPDANAHNDGYKITGLYDFALAVQRGKKDVVANEIRFDNAAVCYILTGPNNGGKTVYMRSVGLAQMMFQLGLPVLASAAEMALCDRIYYVIPKSQESSGRGTGRFESECIILSDILGKMTSRSLVLIDEAFTSTSSEDAVPIAENFLKLICEKNAKCIFSTHFHELVDQPKSEESRLDYLYAGVIGETRTYKIHRGKASVRSQAGDIAKKYGLI